MKKESGINITGAITQEDIVTIKNNSSIGQKIMIFTESVSETYYEAKEKKKPVTAIIKTKYPNFMICEYIKQVGSRRVKCEISIIYSDYIIQQRLIQKGDKS